jgi:hypothetical protein
MTTLAAAFAAAFEKKNGTTLVQRNTETLRAMHKAASK